MAISRPDPANILDASQRAVLALGDRSSAAVLGAPGSGKTTTLIELVADRVLQRGYSPDEILVITPTRATATSLRDRLALRLGVPSNGPLARTANSVAFQIVRGVAAATGLEPPVLLTGAEHDQIIAELLAGDLEEGTGPEWPSPLDADVRRLRGFRTELRDLMMRAVENGVSPRELARLGNSTGKPEWVAAAEFIQGYDTVKASFRERSFDSAELAREAAALLREGRDAQAELASAIGTLASLRLIVLDDAQESPTATLALVRQFAQRGVAVVAFGDPDIGTGSFRGAHPDTLGRLGHHLGVEVAAPIVLESVHRHGGELRSLVARVTSRIGTANAGSQRKAGGASDAQSRIVPVLATSPSDEIALIARRLREAHVFEGLAWDDMAVIVRSGSLIAPLERGLASFDVPTRVSRARVALRDEPVVRSFTAVLELAFGRRELTAELAEALMLGPLTGADAVMLRRLKRALRQREFELEGHRAADELLVEALLEPVELSHIDSRVARRAAVLAGILQSARSAVTSSEASVEELLWDIWQRSGLAEPWYQQSLGTGLVAEETNHNLDAVVALFAAAKRFVERTPEAPGTLFLEQLLDSDVPEDTLARAASTTAVAVTTPTGTIGSEYSLVVVAGVQENVWPNLRVRNSLLGAGIVESAVAGADAEPVDERTGVLHDELRMFAQAISRAKRELVVTAVADDNSVPSPLFRILPDPTPGAISRTPLSLRGMVGVLRRQSTTRADSDSAVALATLARERVPGAHPAEWYGLAPLSTTRPLVDLSAAAPSGEAGPEETQNDEAAPFVRVSPSRMESFEVCPLDWVIDQLGGGSGNTASRLGTLIHKAMEDAVDISPEALFASVDDRWGELYFDSWWLSEIKKADARDLVGRLASYLRDFEKAGGDLVSAESTFELPVGPAVLRGSIDRVEHYPDGSIVIVDLKTGKKSYSADEIAGNAQLGAYQLAFAEGEVPNVPSGATAGGARLLIVSKGSRGKEYLDPTQPPMTAEQLAEFRARIVADAEGMADSAFQARIGSHCLDPWSHGACRIHVIKAVSS